jgi:DNA helicase HerA-like ATPase
VRCAWTFLATDDRGRLYFSEAMDMVSEMARTGRHYNIALVLATQYGKDLMNEQGKTVLESEGSGRALGVSLCMVDVFVFRNRLNHLAPR